MDVIELTMLTSTKPEDSTKPSILDWLRILKNVRDDDFHTKLTAIQNQWNFKTEGSISKTSESPVRVT